MEDYEDVKSFLAQLKDFDHGILHYNEENLLLTPRFASMDPPSIKKYVADYVERYAPTIENSVPLKGIDIYGVKHFSYDQLKEWTENFSADQKLGVIQFGRLFPLITQEPRGAVLKTWDLFFPDYPHYKLHPARLHNELVTLSNDSITHKNLPKLIGYCCEKILGVVYGNLRPKICIYDAILSDDFSWKDRIKAALQLADLIHFMHSKGIAVGTIAKNNIWIDENDDIKLLSFGLLAHGGYRQAKVPADCFFGSYACSAPELSRGVVTVKTDTYAYGILLLELISKEYAATNDPQPYVELAAKRCQTGQSSLVHASFQVGDVIGVKITNLAFSCLGDDPEL